MSLVSGPMRRSMWRSYFVDIGNVQPTIVATAGATPLRVLVKTANNTIVDFAYNTNDLLELTSARFRVPGTSKSRFVLAPGQTLYAKAVAGGQISLHESDVVVFPPKPFTPNTTAKTYFVRAGAPAILIAKAQEDAPARVVVRNLSAILGAIVFVGDDLTSAFPSEGPILMQGYRIQVAGDVNFPRDSFILAPGQRLMAIANADNIPLSVVQHDSISTAEMMVI